jgi:hypothetical protein
VSDASPSLFPWLSVASKTINALTLMLMGLATFAVALVPTYESIGIWGAVILTILATVK